MTFLWLQRCKAWNVSPLPEVYCHKWKNIMLASLGHGMEAGLMLNTDHLYEPSSSFLCLRCFLDVSKSIPHPFWLISDFRRPQSETRPRHLASSCPLLGEDSTTPTHVQEWVFSYEGKANFSTLQRKQGLLQSNLMGAAWHRGYRAGNTHT